MKNLLIALFAAFSLTSVSFGQTTTTGNIEGTVADVAVLEFIAEPGTMPENGTQTLQNGIVEEMNETDKYHKGWIEITNATPAVAEFYRQYLGREPDAAAYAELGRLLGVDYVMYGHVKVIDGSRVGVESRIVKVGTGRLVFATTNTYRGLTYVNDGALQAQTRPVIQRLTASLKAADL